MDVCSRWARSSASLRTFASKETITTDFLRDFMEPAAATFRADTVENYFSKVHFTQEAPEFTVRNINQLISHKSPIAQNLYSLVRGRGIFARIESYKSFLEEIRLCAHQLFFANSSANLVRRVLQPDGVVEFIEIDPRPRHKNDLDAQLLLQNDHKSGVETQWTDKIVDRFKNPLDAELVTNIPGWTARVESGLRASLRPGDGIPAVHLKSWLEGTGCVLYRSLFMLTYTEFTAFGT